MNVSVIIVNFNTFELTKKCINSIFEHTEGLSFEVILVDNASTDGSKPYFEQDNRIIYIYSDENLGFGKANNLGYKFAKGDYLLFLNSDTYLLNNAIYLMWNDFCAQLEKNNDIACFGGLLLSSSGEIVDSYGKFLSLWNDIMSISIFPGLEHFFHLPHSWLSNSNYYVKRTKSHYFDVDYVVGADLMVKKEVADKLGLFDPDFFLYCEETEMQYRYMKAGYRRMITDRPQIVHLEGCSSTSTNYSLWKSKVIIGSHYTYFRKTHSMHSYYLYCFLHKLIYVPYRLFIIPFVGGKLKEKVIHLISVMKMK